MLPKQPMKKTSVNFPKETISEVEGIAEMLGSTKAYAIRYAIRLTYGRLAGKQINDAYGRLAQSSPPTDDPAVVCAGGSDCGCGWDGHKEQTDE